MLSLAFHSRKKNDRKRGASSFPSLSPRPSVRRRVEKRWQGRENDEKEANGPLAAEPGELLTSKTVRPIARIASSVQQFVPPSDEHRERSSSSSPPRACASFPDAPTSSRARRKKHGLSGCHEKHLSMKTDDRQRLRERKLKERSAAEAKTAEENGSRRAKQQVNGEVKGPAQKEEQGLNMARGGQETGADVEASSSSSVSQKTAPQGTKQKRRKKRKRGHSAETGKTKANEGSACCMEAGIRSEKAECRTRAGVCTPGISDPDKEESDPGKDFVGGECRNRDQGSSVSREDCFSSSIHVLRKRKRRKKTREVEREEASSSNSLKSRRRWEGDESVEGGLSDSNKTAARDHPGEASMSRREAEENRRRQKSEGDHGDKTRGQRRRRVFDRREEAEKEETHPNFGLQVGKKKPRGDGQHTVQSDKRELLLQKLQGSRFRSLNECLYTSTGQDAFKAFQKDPSLFDAYHKGFRAQVAQWPVKPLDLVKDWLQRLPHHWRIADLGCGDAELSASFPERRIFSFDLVSVSPNVVACNLAQVPLPGCSVHAAIFCLSLMSKDWPSFLQEAHRILVPQGRLKIAEVLSRVSDSASLIRGIESLGFALRQPEERIASFFLLLEFEKTSNKKKQQADYSEKRTDKRGKKKEYLDGRKIVPKGSGTNAPRKGFCFNGSTSSEGGGARRKEDNRGSSEGLCSSLLKPCIYKRR